jgi:hypothetical protein
MTATKPTPRVRKSDLTKVLSALEATGLHPTGVDILPDGTVRVLTASGEALTSDSGAAFAAWWKNHGQER